MKVFLLLFFTLFLASISHSQTASLEILVNGQKQEKTLSKSNVNFLTVEGTGYDRFELSCIGGITLVKKDNGYLAKNLSGKVVSISVFGIKRKKKFIVATFEFKIID